ncbi:hypothetical protein QJS10_CPA02g00342 [Acorus calamus]|uniref:Uncharacterized protein n=1 Tax=Acorus calamus TaxID=4465 RepID=A0AAV9FBN4_ACOCL|nr:hypothetical protein QJS10_CPA02g00342 [Acorus calamus]
MMSTFSSSARARPLRTFDKEAKECFEGFIDGLAIWGVKTAGQNPGGKGHGFTTIDTLGGIKNSGLAPGLGHAQVVRSNHQS